MAETTSTVRWLVAAAVAAAIIGLLAYARGDDSDDGRSPELEGLAPAAEVVVVDGDAVD